MATKTTDETNWVRLSDSLEKLKQRESDELPDVLKKIDDSIALNTDLAQTIEYAGPGWASYTVRAMESAGQQDGLAVPPIPSTAQKTPTGIESDLIETYGKFYSDVYDFFNQLNEFMRASLQRLRTKIEQMANARRDLTDASGNYYAAEIEALSPSDANIQRVRDLLGTRVNTFLDKRNIFQTFRAAHGLHRNPQYESSVLAFLFIAIICIVVETAVNGFMYGQASELGLIGGWGVAAGLSIVIFSSSFMAGWILTYKNALRQVKATAPEGTDDESQPRRRSQPIWKHSSIFTLIAWSGWIVLSALILVLIAFVCVYRDEAATFDPSTGTHPMTEAVSRLATLDLMPRADIEGLLLIFVNLAIMIIAMYKGYTHFDTIPRYRAHAKELAKQRQQFKETIQQAQKDLKIADMRFEDKLPRYTESDLSNLVHRYADGVAALEQLQKSLDRQTESITEDGNARLNAYRNANESARPNDIHPAPACFKERWKPPTKPPLAHRVEPLDDIDTSAIVDTLKQHRAAALKGLIKQATDIYNDEISRYVQESERYHYEVNQKEA